MRLIDADALLTTMEVKCPMENDLDSFMAGMRAVLDRICDAPTVEAVQVVRCGECKHYRTSDAGHPDCDYCNRLICGTVRPDFYCADGERLEDDGND